MALVGKKFGVVIISALLMAGFAHGATEEVQGQNVLTTEKSIAKRILEKTSFSYFGFLVGPMVMRPGSYSVDSTTGKETLDNPIGIDSQFRANYALNDSGLYVGPFITAFFKPTVGQAATLTDSGFRIGHTKFLSRGDFNWSADARFLAPLSQGSIDRDVVFRIQSTHSMTYAPAGSRLAYGMFTSIFKSFLGPRGAKQDLGVYLGPNITYKTSDTLSITTYFEFYPNHIYGDDIFTFRLAPYDINPMVNIQVNKVLTFSPGVVYYPSLGTVESLSYMAYVFAAL